MSWHLTPLILTFFLAKLKIRNMSLLTLKSYWRTGRGVSRRYVLVNLVGLATSFLVALLLHSYISFESSYDEALSQVYRVNSTWILEGESRYSAQSPVPLADDLADHLPVGSLVVRVDHSDALVRYQGQVYNEDHLVTAEAGFMELFQVEVLAGDPTGKLSEPYSVVLTASMAKKYFGEADPIDQELRIYKYDPDGQGADYRVTAVIADPPTNQHLPYQALISYATAPAAFPAFFADPSPISTEFYTYVQPVGNPESLSTLLHSLAPVQQDGVNLTYNLQPITSIHLYSDLEDELPGHGTHTTVAVARSLLAIVLLLVGINFTIMSLAQAHAKLRQVGIKRVLGARSVEVVREILVSNCLLILLAMGCAMTVLLMLGPSGFSILPRFAFPLAPLHSLVVVTGLGLLVGLLASALPAVLLVRVQLLSALKEKVGTQPGWVNRFRSGLVTLQVTVLVGVLATALLVRSQLQHLMQYNLGFQPQGVISLRTNGDEAVMAGYAAFRDALLQIPEVEAVGTTNSMLVDGLDEEMIAIQGQGQNQEALQVSLLRSDRDFTEVFGVPLLAGRNFSPSAMEGASEFLINERMLTTLGMAGPEEALGLSVTADGWVGTIVGVVQDFHFDNLRAPLTGLFIQQRTDRFSQIAVRVSGHTLEGLGKLQEAWKTAFPQALFEYRYYEDALASSYQAEAQLLHGLQAATIFIILVSALGVLGLSEYISQAKLKEAGVRKVLGASWLGVYWLNGRVFVAMTALAGLLALPFAWWGYRMFSAEFTYALPFQWSLFVLGLVISLLLMLSLTLYHGLRLAWVNPVKILKQE
ncbi:MAG: ABC transporter permease [Bacteroidota bacterium]